MNDSEWYIYTWLKVILYLSLAILFIGVSFMFITAAFADDTSAISEEMQEEIDRYIECLARGEEEHIVEEHEMADTMTRDHNEDVLEMVYNPYEHSQIEYEDPMDKLDEES